MGLHLPSVFGGSPLVFCVSLVLSGSSCTISFQWLSTGYLCSIGFDWVFMLDQSSVAVLYVLLVLSRFSCTISFQWLSVYHHWFFICRWFWVGLHALSVFSGCLCTISFQWLSTDSLCTLGFQWHFSLYIKLTFMVGLGVQINMRMTTTDKNKRLLGLLCSRWKCCAVKGGVSCACIL